MVSHPPLRSFRVMQQNKEPVLMQVSDKKLTMSRGDVTAQVSVPKNATQANVLKAVEKPAAKFKAAELAAD